MLILSTLLGTTWVSEGGGGGESNYPPAPPGLTGAQLGALIGVTAPIQAQLDGKSPLNHTHDDLYEPLNPDLVETADLATMTLNGGYF